MGCWALPPQPLLYLGTHSARNPKAPEAQGQLLALLQPKARHRGGPGSREAVRFHKAPVESIFVPGGPGVP